MTHEKETPELAKRFYSTEDVQKLFGFGRNKTLALIKSEGFPAIRIGRAYYTDSEKLEEWIATHRGKEIHLDLKKGNKKDGDEDDKF